MGFLTIASLHFLAVVSPGPDFAMVVKNSIMHSRRPAIYTALGISFGIWVHVIYCIMGLAFVISQSILLFSIVKYIGAAYLIFLGVQTLLSKGGKDNPVFKKHDKNLTPGRAFKQGFICNVFNPKATLFFLSVFTLVIEPGTAIWIQLLYGLEMFIITFLWFAFLALAITHPRIKGSIHRIQHYATKFMGGLLILFGLKLALTEN